MLNAGALGLSAGRGFLFEDYTLPSFTMLHLFPVELALKTISSLPLQALYCTNLVSRDWHALITTNEHAVYRNAALLHRFVDRGQLLSGAETVITDWKVYCRRQLEIDRGWRGKASAVVQELTATGPMVHRIQVDYERDFVITTALSGGLCVSDIKTNRILWSLPRAHVNIYVHVEYDGGYMVFNRHDDCKEVWRHTIDAEGDPPSKTLPPDKLMRDVSAQAEQKYRSPGNRRGHFTAWALLRTPDFCQWFRLSYPNLLGVAMNNAYVWDITTMQMVSTIRDIRRAHQGVRMAGTRYAEVNNLYVFICCQDGLRIFSKESGALLYQLSMSDLPSTSWDVRPQGWRSATTAVDPQILRFNNRAQDSPPGSFIACHVSASGNGLAILTANGKLVILPRFQALFRSRYSHQNTGVMLNFQSSPTDENIGCYLAVGSRNGKLAVATAKGIYVVSPDIDFSRTTADRPPTPGVTVCQLADFDDEGLLSQISCLQITHDAAYFTYKPSDVRLPVGMNTVYSVRF